MNQPADQIRAEIHKLGTITFARFMELALYCPLCGYYEKKEDTPGRQGDFYTSVSVGPLFGQLLAYQFAEWMTGSARPVPGKAIPPASTPKWSIVEAGAHDGRLACDLLNWLQLRRPMVFAQLQYIIVEPSTRRREWQRDTLKHFTDHIEWVEDLATVRMQSEQNPEPAASSTIIFSNELLDAFPVHRVSWNAETKSWFEWGVGLEDQAFVWEKLKAVSTELHEHLPGSPELLEILPQGFTMEVCPAAVSWWRSAAAILRSGHLLTFDYGWSGEEFLSPAHAAGTLRAYRRHRLAESILSNPGEQDLTAHVNFSAIQAAGESCGLVTQTFVSQARFLTTLGEKVWKPENGFGPWTPECTRQFKTLTHPELLGRAFRVLIQCERSRECPG